MQAKTCLTPRRDSAADDCTQLLSNHLLSPEQAALIFRARKLNDQDPMSSTDGVAGAVKLFFARVVPAKDTHAH